MKKTLLLSLASIFFCAAGYAQKIMVVNTEKVFKAVAAYQTAQTTLEDLSKQYQKTIDDAYTDVEKMYNDYQAVRAQLSASARQQREDVIINREKEIAKYQEDVFGPEGDLMKKRVELIKPIQDNVFKVINEYAKAGSYTLVLDIATNPTILYYAPEQDKTDEIINRIK